MKYLAVTGTDENGRVVKHIVFDDDAPAEIEALTLVVRKDIIKAAAADAVIDTANALNAAEDMVAARIGTLTEPDPGKRAIAVDAIVQEAGLDDLTEAAATAADDLENARSAAAAIAFDAASAAAYIDENVGNAIVVPYPGGVRQNWLVQGTEVIVAPPEPNMALVRAEGADAVILAASKFRKATAGSADAYKLAAWAEKAQRARRWLAGNGSEADQVILQSEADERGLGEGSDDLAATIVAKADGLAQVAGKVEGAEKSALTAIDAAETAADVQHSVVEFVSRFS